jgi:alkylation response protein AidB-like acyl-CoA dehydrogenase
VLDGEKWHVTSGDVADFFLVHATSTATRPRRPCSWWTRTPRACGSVRTPKYTHTFVFEHPIFAFDGVRLADDRGPR